MGPVAISNTYVVIGTLRGQVLLYTKSAALNNAQRAGFESGESFALPSSWDSVCVHAALGTSATTAHCRAVVFSPCQAQFAVAWANGNVKVFNAESTACENNMTMILHSNEVYISNPSQLQVAQPTPMPPPPPPFLPVLKFPPNGYR